MPAKHKHTLSKATTIEQRKWNVQGKKSTITFSLDKHCNSDTEWHRIKRQTKTTGKKHNKNHHRCNNTLKEKKNTKKRRMQKERMRRKRESRCEKIAFLFSFALISFHRVGSQCQSQWQFWSQSWSQSITRSNAVFFSSSSSFMFLSSLLF